MAANRAAQTTKRLPMFKKGSAVVTDIVEVTLDDEQNYIWLSVNSETVWLSRGEAQALAWLLEDAHLHLWRKELGKA